MIFLQFWWTLMVLTGTTNTLAPQAEPQAGSEQLRSFHNSVQEAHEQLHEIRSNYGDVQGAELYRHRRNSIDDLLASFAQAGEKETAPEKDDKELQQAADDWFRDMQAGVVHVLPAAGAGKVAGNAGGAAAAAATNGDAVAAAAGAAEETSALVDSASGKYSRGTDKLKSRVYGDSYGKAMEQTEMGKVKKKYQDLTDMNLPVKHLPEKQPYEVIRGGATELDIKLKHVQRLLHNQEMEQSRAEERKQAKPNKEAGQLPQYGDEPVPDGVYEQTLARLQVARVSNPNNLSHEANYKLSKIEQEAAEQSAKTRYPSGILKKRSSTSGFNPMNEIKLKTSNRLMRKGMGPSLPSNALTDTLRAHYVDDIIMRRERKLERERHKAQQQQLQQRQLDGEEEKISPVSSYDTLNALDSSVGSSLDAPNVHLMDMPQSYDYHLPHFEQFPAPSQQRSLPNLRDYAHANAKLKVERDRYKRHPEQLLETDAQLEQSEAGLDADKAKTEQGKDKLPEAEDLMAKLTAPVAADDKVQAKLDMTTANAAKEEQQTAAVKAEAVDPIVEPKPQGHTQVKEIATDVQTADKQMQAVNDNEPKQLRAQAQMQMPETQPINEAKSQLVNKAQPMGQLAAKQKDDGLQKASNGKLKREQPHKVAELGPRSGICKSHPDAVVKLLANKISQHSSDKDRDKRHIKRWSWHRVHRQKANHNANVANETPHYKRRSKRSVDQPPVETQAEPLSEGQSDPQTRTHAEGQSEGLSEPQVAGQSEGQSESHSEGQSDALSEPQSEGQSSPQLEPEPRSKRQPKLEPQAEAQLKQQASAEANAQVEPQAQSQSEILPEEQSEGQSNRPPQDASKRSSKLLDSFEDHNGNRVGFGSLGNGMLTLETEEDNEGDGLPYPRHQRSIFKKEEAAQEVGTVDSNTFSNSRYQVPMMNQRNNNLVYQQQQQLQQHQLQQQQQPQPFVPQQQLLPQQLQPCQPQVLQRQQPQQQQLQLQQQQQQANNFKANFNLTHLFNELSKLQKPPLAQQQQELQQQQQLQQQQPQLHQQQQQQLMPQQHQQQQQAAATSLETNQLKPLYGVHRYFGPLFNKGNKLNVVNDPCVAITPAAGTTAALAGGSTLNPDCVPISTEATGTTAMPAGEEQQASNPCNSPDAVKLNVSLNARVCSDPRTKQIYGNGSICVQPSQQRLNADAYYTLQDALVDDNDEDLDSEERYSRQARQRSEEECKDRRKSKGKKSHESGGKRAEKKKSAAAKKAKAEQAKSSSSNCTGDPDGKPGAECTAGARKLDLNEPYSENYNKLLTGRLSEDIVTAVFDMVGNDPSLDALIPVLTRNNKCAAKHPKNFYQIRNNKNEKDLQEKEEMLRRTIESISDIIDKQMQQRNCIPLRPDLVEFYNIIMKSMAEQQKSRDKREANLRVLADDYDEKLRILDPANIEQKSRIVKKLLRQYEELPLEEQQHAASVRDELLMDLIYLRKMSDTLERGQRNAQLQNVLRKSSISDDADDPQAYQDYTPRFIKLLRTAEIFKEVGEQQARAFIGL